jgi:hypothetical protein
MSILSRLFGGKSDTLPAPSAVEEYKGFRITPTPARDGGQFRIGARIEKEVGGTLKRHDLIRADTFTGQDEAAAASTAKARQMIDEQGDRLFG